MNVLECSNLTCRFNGTVALDGLSIEIADRQCVSVVGHNGAGKTTLLNAICGLTRTQVGTVRLNGVDVSTWPFSRRAALGLIRSFEDAGIWSRLSVLDNAALGAYGLPLAEARRLASVRLADVGLAEYEREEAASLSLGLRRRMELAKILTRRQVTDARSVLVLDEPFRGLDAVATATMTSLLRDHVIGRCAALLVEHEVERAQQLSSCLINLRNGRIAPSAEETEEAADCLQPGISGDGRSLPAVRLVDLYAGYGAAVVLRGVNLSLLEGEAVHVIGPNGAGKSTLLRVLVGTLRPLRGRVEFFGRVADALQPRVRLGVGYAPQGGRLVKDLTVRTHIGMAKEAATQRSGLSTAFISAFPEAEGLLSRRAGELSSGQRSLVALWTALATEPRLLLADEPGAGLAPDLRRRVYDFLRMEYLKQGRSLLFVEHGPALPWARPAPLDHGVVR